MGYDTSFHPVDLALIEERLLPYVKGQGSIDDLVADAIRIGRVRLRAYEWALAARRTNHPGIDPWLHVWGRPFFITVDGPDAIGAAIDRYLAAQPWDVNGIAREMLAVIDPALADEVEVEPYHEGFQASDAEAGARIRYGLDLLRTAYPNLISGKPLRSKNGERHDPKEVFAVELPLTILKFAAHFRPGWMDRNVSPTWLLDEGQVRKQRDLKKALELFGPPLALVGDIGERVQISSSRLSGNYSVGGMLEAAKVSKVRDQLERNRGHLEKALDFSLRKMLEALADAERRGLPFAEATEIYIGAQTIVN